MKTYFLFFICLFYNHILIGQIIPSHIDPTFQSGIGANGLVHSIELQPDNKVIIAGVFTSYNGVNVNRVIRLNTNGTKDNSFNFGNIDGGVTSIELQEDGKLLVAGSFSMYNGNSCNSMVRVNTNGSFDSTFNAGLGADDNINTINMLADGKIIIAGYFTNFDNVPMNRVARLNSDGSLDTTFNIGNGVQGSGLYVGVMSTFIQPDEKVFIVGNFSGYDGVTSKKLARINSDGSIDSTFLTGDFVNGGGITCTALQNDGKILICGSFTSYNGNVIRQIARLNADGSFDNSFTSGNAGFLEWESTPYAVAIQSDGKIVVGGNFTAFNTYYTSRLTRLNTDRSLDLSFYSNSNVNLEIDNPVNVIAMQNDGKILVGGQFTLFNGSNSRRIVRLNGSDYGSTSDLTNISNPKIILFPNPANDEIRFQNLTKDALVRISSLTGCDVFHQKVTPEQSVDIRGIHPGIYFVHLEIEKQQYVFKLKID